MRGEVCALADRRAWGVATQAAHARGEGSTKGWGRARAERTANTANIFFMVVTLDVSKLSG